MEPTPTRTKDGTKRKIKAADPRTDKRRKENRIPSPAQVATQFKQGNPGGAAIERSTRLNDTKELRSKCRTAVRVVMVEKIINMAYLAEERGDFKFALDAWKFLKECGYGRASIMEDGEEIVPEASLNLIVTTNDKLAAARAANAAHAAEYEDADDTDPDTVSAVI